MTSQTIHSGRTTRVVLILAAAAFFALLAASTAGARAPARHPGSSSRADKGCRSARRAGRPKAAHACKRKATTVPAAATVPAAVPAPIAPTPEAAPTGGLPAAPPVVTSSAPELHAEIGTGFSQNPLVPNEVTWRFSASATRTVTTDGVAQTETLPLPEGELAFFVDGQLDCEIHAVGAISGSACTVALKQLGAHEVSTIFQSDHGSSTAVRTDYVGRYPTSTKVQVSVEPTAPEYVDIGPNAYGFEQYGFEVGRLRIVGATGPGGYPSFDCEGQARGCLEPEVSLKSHNGSVAVPLYAQYRLNSATGREEWHVAFEATNPALHESGEFWQFPEEAVGAQFFHAVSEPTPSLYEPSSTTVPLNLNGGHYPFHRWMKAGETGGSVAAVEGTPRKVTTIGTYEKFAGPAEWLKVTSQFHGVQGESEGCVYRLGIDGQLTNETRRALPEGWGFYNGWPGYAAGPHTFEIWVERQSGAGPGNCAIASGTFEAWEVAH